MKTHYDVLQVDKKCSEKEIKDSFIKLSKKYHPDKNKNADAHKKFVEVNEAYSVLGKPASRREYDATLPFETSRSTADRNIRYRSYTVTPYEYYREMYAQNLRKHQDGSQSYFTKSKMAAVCFCFVLMAIGSGLQMIALFHRRKLHSQDIATKFKEANERRQWKRQRLQKQQQKTVTENETMDVNMNPREY